MPQPDAGDVFVNTPLTNLSIAYRNLEFVADAIFPPLPVEQQSGIIADYDRDMWMRSQAQVRAPMTRAARSGFTVNTTATYFARNFAIGMAIPREVEMNARLPFDMDRDATEWVTHQIQLAREVEFASAAFASSVWTTEPTVSTKWDDEANSTPVVDIQSNARTVRQIIGRRPNVFACGEIVWDRLKLHPDFLERVKYGGSPDNPAVVNRRAFASIVEVEEVHVASAFEVSSAEGASSETRADVIDDDALLLYRAPRPSLLNPSGGYGIFWRPATGGGQQFIRSIDKQEEMGRVVEAHSYFHYKVTAADAGAFFSDAVD